MLFAVTKSVVSRQTWRRGRGTDLLRLCHCLRHGFLIPRYRTHRTHQTRKTEPGQKPEYLPLPETDEFSPLKMDGWNTIVSFRGPAYFQGLC